MDPGVAPGAFCKVAPDLLGGDPGRCCVIHSDGAGSKSALAYLWYRETGDASVFRGIAQDSIVMNLDDLLCVGVTGPILLSSTINRNARNCPGEVVEALIEGGEAFLEELRGQGVAVHSGGGETADVGDLTGTVVVDSCAVASMARADLIANRIGPGLAIVGLASTGKARYESRENSGIGSNGLTSARHDLLDGRYGRKYPESFDPGMPGELAYSGRYGLDDALPDSPFTVGEALLCPTRTYAPLILALRERLGGDIAGLVHCSGGGQTKCLRFGEGVHFVKDAVFPVPAVFRAIQGESGVDSREMYRVFNMGWRMEVYLEERWVEEVVALAAEFGIDAKQVGRTEGAVGGNRLSIACENGEVCEYEG